MTRDSKPYRTGLRASFQAALAIVALSRVVGCKPAVIDPASEPRTFDPPVVRDTSTADRIDCIKESGMYSASYMVGYVGALADSVVFDGSLQIGKEPTQPYEDPIPNAPDSVIHVAIDTSQRVAIEQMVFRMGERQTREAFVGYPVFVINRSADTVAVGTRPHVALILQGQGPDGKWRPLEHPLMNDCGFGLRSQLLPPGAVAVTAISICKGGLPTNLRICYGNSCSETFVGSADPALFQDREAQIE
jgi:hypothetical protein